MIRGEHGYVKLGSSIRPVRRVAELQTGSPFRLEIVNTVPVSYNAREIELEAHAILDRHRMAGEWFAVTPELAMAAIYAAADRMGRSLTDASTEEPFAWWKAAILRGLAMIAALLAIMTIATMLSK